MFCNKCEVGNSIWTKKINNSDLKKKFSLVAKLLACEAHIIQEFSARSLIVHDRPSDDVDDDDDDDAVVGLHDDAYIYTSIYATCILCMGKEIAGSHGAIVFRMCDGLECLLHACYDKS